MTLFKDLPPHSRIWVYQSERELFPNETGAIKEKANEFVAQWTSHDQLMKASIEVFHNRFIVVCVDEKILSSPLSELKNIGEVTVFNNLVATKEEFETSWEVPVKKSWHKKFI